MGDRPATPGGSERATTPADSRAGAPHPVALPIDPLGSARWQHAGASPHTPTCPGRSTRAHSPHRGRDLGRGVGAIPSALVTHPARGPEVGVLIAPTKAPGRDVIHVGGRPETSGPGELAHPAVPSQHPAPRAHPLATPPEVGGWLHRRRRPAAVCVRFTLATVPAWRLATTPRTWPWDPDVFA